MLLYPDQIEEKLEVSQIRQLIENECNTTAGRQWLDKSKPIRDFGKLDQTLRQTNEAIGILELSEKPAAHFEDLGELIKRLKTEGVYLDAEKYLLLKIGLQSLYQWTQFLKKRQIECPELVKLTYGFISDKLLVDTIDRIIDEKGEVRHNASPLLSELRSEIIKSEKKVRTSLQKVLDKARSDKYAEEDMEITIREGRLVIPVRSEHKRHIPGLIHDESATGQTVFMEPSSVLELNNRVKELRYQEKREIQRILLELADLVRESLSDVEKGTRFLGLMDYILAKAKFGKKLEATIPKLKKSSHLSLINAYHPLLKSKNDQQGKETVPLTLELNNQDQRILVVSGPNAGGKSVTLKTVGLLQYMLQCGWPVTVDESSEMGVFQEIFLDIGDSQSLENDLSTYSSRLKAMNYFLEFSGKRTLILIDEFGTGTEPQFGGALAEVILSELNEKKSFGVITTHYGNIKQLADESEGIVNGAMKYDTDQLKPLYALETGKPGSSFAFEIARNIGMQKMIIEAARQKVGKSHVDYDRMLTELETEIQKYKDLSQGLDHKENELKSLKKDYEALRKMIETEKKQIIRNAKQEAQEIISRANRDIEKTIREIKEHGAKKEQTLKARQRLQKTSDSLGNGKKENKSNKSTSVIKVGDKVKIEGQSGAGEVIELGKKEARVRFGSITSFISFERLEKVGTTSKKSVSQKRFGGIDFEKKLTEFENEIDVRGKKPEEVIPLLDRFINDALITGMSELKILHGKGHGILREVVRNHLTGDPNVEKFNDEHVERGGSGITLVTLK